MLEFAFTNDYQLLIMRADFVFQFQKTSEKWNQKEKIFFPTSGRFKDCQSHTKSGAFQTVFLQRQLSGDQNTKITAESSFKLIFFLFRKISSNFQEVSVYSNRRNFYKKVLPSFISIVT